jgi:hypothetical protein
MPDVPPRHRGIPRSHKVAKSLGYKKSRINFDDVKDNFIQFADFGSRSGSVCGVAPDPDPRFWAVCYKDGSGECNWVKVPRTEPQGH